MIFAKNHKNVKFYRTTILIWALFILYECLVTYFLGGKFASLADYVSAYTLNILLFYANAGFVLPKTHHKSIPYIILAEILLWIAYAGVKYAITLTFFQLGWSASNPLAAPQFFLAQTIWRFIYFVGLSWGYWFALNIIRQRKEISDLEKSQLLDRLKSQELEKQLVDSENAYLKSQINPHFLFNTLNFLYNSALQSAPILSKPIMLLSDIMRYALTEVAQNGKVNLEDELEQITTFIELNQYRFEHNLQLNYTLAGNSTNFKILPLILLTPVENIFKYADLRNPAHPAQISIEIKEGQLYFSISNRKLKSRQAIASQGIGLKNLQLRLEAYYTNAHQVKVSQDNDNYSFELQITL
jgi:two-component system LytT family sensor kinase